VRQVGSDIRSGEVLLKKGSIVTAADMGLLAACRIQQIHCTIRPIVGVLSTGDELGEQDATPADGQIRDSNRLALLNSFSHLQVIRVDFGNGV
jgi:molybdopterin molybdotransferase